MANRNFQTIQALQRGLKIICGSFAPNGASAVDSADNEGIGFSVARSAAGQFTVTLQDKYISLLSGSCNLQLVAPDDKFAQFGAIDVVSAQTVVINVWDVSGAGLSDISADPQNRIHFCLVLSNSTVV